MDPSVITQSMSCFLGALMMIAFVIAASMRF